MSIVIVLPSSGRLTVGHDGTSLTNRRTAPVPTSRPYQRLPRGCCVIIHFVGEASKRREENDDISRSPPAHRVRTAGASLRQCGIRRAVWPGQSEEGSQVFAMGCSCCRRGLVVHLAGCANGDGEGIGLMGYGARWRREHRRTAGSGALSVRCVALRCVSLRQPRLRGLIMTAYLRLSP